MHLIRDHPLPRKPVFIIYKTYILNLRNLVGIAILIYTFLVIVTRVFTLADNFTPITTIFAFLNTYNFPSNILANVFYLSQLASYLYLPSVVILKQCLA